MASEQTAGAHAHDEGAEKAILGILLSGDRPELLTEARRRLQPEDFYHPHHQLIFETVAALNDEEKPVEVPSVAAELVKRDQLKQIPGEGIYLTELFSTAPAPSSLTFYVGAVKEAATRRSVAVLGVRAQQLAQPGAGETPASIIEQLRADLDKLSNTTVSDDLSTFGDVLAGTLNEIQTFQTVGAVKGVSTGFTDLDSQLTGLQPGQMIIIAARPGMGKALALDTPLPTPTGWTTMGEIQPGEQLLSPTGRPVTVLGATRVMFDRECYQLTFSDGSNIVADADHLWRTRSDMEATTVHTTRELSHYPGGSRIIDYSDAERAQEWVRIMEVRETRSVPVRCVEVDADDGMFLAGETSIPTHNSALALDIARNAAVRQDKSVLIFSLEMSDQELGMRALAAEAFVDAKKLRVMGALEEADWQKLLGASTRMKDKVLGIDDDATVTIADIRAKARIWQRKYGLDMIVIDYLQLMNSATPSSSRQQEVSEISRGVKLLAKELNVPVIALSQLNRGPEQRQDKKPVISDLRESGCLTRGTRVLRSDTNTWITMGELYDSQAKQIPVWAMGPNHRLYPAIMSHVFSTGHRTVFRLSTLNGRTLYATRNHPLYGKNGWAPLEAYSRGDEIAAAPEILGHIPLAHSPEVGTPIIWDPITNIEEVSHEEVFDATVPGPHNFLAEGVVVHNSLEQDADVVMLLHREDAYDRESPRAGEADVIIAKQRAGPTGQVVLTWLGKYSRFDNYSSY